jgi:hypothetical protein
MRVTFLTVGEYPTGTGLHASQVLPFAAYLRTQGVSVDWIAFVPLEMRLRDLLVNKGSLLADMRKLAARHDIEFTVCLFPITIVRAYSYIFRRRLVDWAGRKLAKMLGKSDGGAEPHIFHCRSYFATAIALEASKRNEQIRVSFDMRSLLPPEVPLMFPTLGKYLYGGLKEWESALLRQADCSFLPCLRGIRLLELEGAGTLPIQIPIAGFDDVPVSGPQENLLNQALIGYVGGLGAWHSAKMLEALFLGLTEILPRCTFEVLTTDAFCSNLPIRVYSLPHHLVQGALSRMLAMVIPGPEPELVDGYFTGSKLSANFFSTKAAEALSVGVPLLVNARIRELADYVRENRCGLVFNLENGRLSFEGVDETQLRSSLLWDELRRGAQTCAREFKAQAVYLRYLAVWKKSF